MANIRQTGMKTRFGPVAFLLIVMAGCGSSPMHQQESFDPKAPYQYRLPTDPESACNAAKLALLSQGYVTDSPSPNQLKANKTFQPEDDSHVTIDFNVFCAATRKGTMLYANAQESRYDLKKTSKSAELNIASVGGISLPWGTSSEALVKVSGLTIDEPAFYRRFYDLIDQQLGITAKR